MAILADYINSIQFFICQLEPLTKIDFCCTIEQISGGRMNKNKIILTTFFASLAIIIFGMSAVLIIEDRLPPATMDAEDGKERDASMRNWMPMVHNEEAIGYVTKIGNRLESELPSDLRYSEFQYTYRIEHSNTLGAQSIAGGFVYVDCGLILEAKNEGELAGIIAHEIAHSALRHDARSNAEKI